MVIGFTALGGTPIPSQVSAWVAVFILPLNAAINPIVYTISALDCRKKYERLAFNIILLCCIAVASSAVM